LSSGLVWSFVLLEKEKKKNMGVIVACVIMRERERERSDLLILSRKVDIIWTQLLLGI
jgi:hypothetical protein